MNMHGDAKRGLAARVAHSLAAFLLIGTALLGARGFAADPSAAGAVDAGWPKQLDVAEGKIIIYQPQPETLEGNILKGRAAVSVTPKGKAEPIFGALWFESQVDIDRDARQVRVLSSKIPRVRLADVSEENQKLFVSIVEREMGSVPMTLSYDRLLASLDAAAAEKKTAEGLKHDPPAIVFETMPAILVVCDGEPELREAGAAGVMKVVNSPFFMALHGPSKTYWLFGGTRWYGAVDPRSEWKPNPAPPSEVVQVHQQELAATGADPNAKPEPEKDKRIPKIIFATEPTELIVADGEPKFTPLPGNALLYMSNTESDVFMEVGGQQYYVVLSGRWFRGASMNGPWEFVRSDQLPAGFADIPEKSAKGQVRTFVAGTQEAEEAVMDAAVPQTAAIQRNEAKVEVTYDGEPQFKPVPKTTIEYAVNSPQAVLHIGTQYYVCDNAVWFVGPSPKGPWAVADSVPPEVQTIPPESPVHHVKYVQVYATTPQVV